jgi:hypothetical protein
MRKAIWVVLACLMLTLTVGLMFSLGRTQSSAVKTCRADARRFAQENASYEAEYDSLYGATTLGQRSISDFLDRDSRLMEWMSTDSGNRKEYKAVLYRDGFIQNNRVMKYLGDTQQMRDFAQWEKTQQATQLANYRSQE